ncbi:type I polyketide synthase [Polyangium sp. 15x6]|uniref:type I polyketide synthase n=1 Tax=Polyangium sp. 15x6 TaxID=3042687 RepID=UPI00249CBA41|nr:type I polyketide synthase [Polyangium sp. 15x6]MDI3284906.1 type I polyketide synthase [Polyangium sp. 15x6]
MSPPQRGQTPSDPTPLQRAIAALEKMKARLDAVERASNEPLAVVGMGCRFPGGGEGPEAFWQVLANGVDAVREIPATRWPSTAMPAHRPEVRWAALLDDVAGFDPSFFGISPREAESLDPQQRMLLEVTWEALEDAAQRPDLIMGSQTGIFLGICSTDYQQAVVAALAGRYDAYCTTGNMFSTAAGRLAFFLGAQGPTISMDTACSSSLVAMAQACQSLRARDCDLALVGGVNAILSPVSMLLLAETQALSPDGRCKTLDARANGFVRGEGCGILVLKRLSDALRDGDRIRALVRGWAVNQDGRSTGLTTPNVLSQQAMLRQALERARLTPADIGYIEMHGTGTSLGDPIEAESLREVFGEPSKDGSSCVLGAVKTNIGHLEGAAGVAGVIKAILAMEHERIPKNLHFRRLNPRISMEGTPFVIPAESVPWLRGQKVRRAGVSSFGISGTNAHVILEEAPLDEGKAPAKEASAYLLPLSAKSPEALSAAARSYAEWLSRDDEMPLHDVTYTASVRRMHHEHRLAVVGATREALAANLSSFARGESSSGWAHGKTSTQGRPKVAFVFSGQGSQWAEMGRKLQEEEPVFRAKLAEVGELLRAHTGLSLLDELAAPEERSRLGETEIVQPALFALEVALAELLKSWGVVPDAVIGHSVGEVAAAHVAGALSLADAVRLVVLRGRIMQRATGHGKMAWVSLPADEAAKAIAGREDVLAIGAVNDPTSVVLSGETAALEELVAKLSAQGVVVRPLRVNYAFHSPQMEPLARALVEELGRVDAEAGSIPMYSTVTGARLLGTALDAAYWGRNVRGTVDLVGAVSAALGDEHRVLVEVGPHPVVLTNLQQCIESRGVSASAVPTLRRQSEERRAMLEALGRLHVEGVEIDWKRLYPAGGRVVSLPAYPWQRERFWIEWSGQTAIAPAPHMDPLAELLHALEWRPQEPVTAPMDTAERTGAWLISCDEGGVGEAVAALLEKQGQTCVRVRVGARFAQLGPRSFALDPANPEEHDLLLRHAFVDAGCRGIVHLMALDATPTEQTTEETLARDQARGFLAAIHLLQAVLRHGWRDNPPLWLVTRGVARAGAQPVTCVSQAPMWGLGRTIALEFSDLTCKLVDLSPAAHPDEARWLLRELTAGGSEDQIALRNEGRYVARMARVPADTLPSAGAVLRPDATYLITGGLGALGLATAQWMVEAGARHLALVGIKGPSAAASEVLRGLGEAGARVLVLQGDVARREEVASILEEIERQAPPLRGIVHAAGVAPEPAPLIELGRETFEHVIAPKVAGTWNLHALTLGMPLDFFVLYSSASALLGLVGKASYAGANAFLDAMASFRHGRGLSGMSIQWGAFVRVGMTQHGSAAARLGAGMGLTPAEGTTALARLLAHPRPEIGVLRFSMQQWREIFPQLAGHPFWSEFATEAGSAPEVAAPAQGFRSTLERAAPEERIVLVEALVLERIGQVLHREAVRIDRLAPFSALGMDSLMSLELRNRLEPGFGLKISAAQMFAHPTAAALAAHLLDRLALPDAEATPADEPARAPAHEAAPAADPQSADSLAEDDVEARLRAKLAALDALLD